MLFFILHYLPAIIKLLHCPAFRKHYCPGLVTVDELKEREAQIKLDQERAEQEKYGKKKKKKREIKTLSFDLADEEEEQEEEIIVKKKRKKIGKNPAVNTSFLPDKDREAQELQEIGKLLALFWSEAYQFLSLYWVIENIIKLPSIQGTVHK